MTPNYARISQFSVARLLNRMSPFYIDGHWRTGEYALAASVVAQFLGDTIAPFVKAHRLGKPAPQLKAGFDAELESVGHWCGVLGIAHDMPKRILRDLGVV